MLNCLPHNTSNKQIYWVSLLHVRNLQWSSNSRWARDLRLCGARTVVTGQKTTHPRPDITVTTLRYFCPDTIKSLQCLATNCCRDKTSSTSVLSYCWIRLSLMTTNFYLVVTEVYLFFIRELWITSRFTVYIHSNGHLLMLYYKRKNIFNTYKPLTQVNILKIIFELNC